jgi:hypothetical protein
MCLQLLRVVLARWQRGLQACCMCWSEKGKIAAKTVLNMHEHSFVLFIVTFLSVLLVSEAWW